jgi:hypothetical protein
VILWCKYYNLTVNSKSGPSVNLTGGGKVSISNQITPRIHVLPSPKQPFSRLSTTLRIISQQSERVQFSTEMRRFPIARISQPPTRICSILMHGTIFVHYDWRTSQNDVAIRSISVESVMPANIAQGALRQTEKKRTSPFIIWQLSGLDYSLSM